MSRLLQLDVVVAAAAAAVTVVCKRALPSFPAAAAKDRGSWLMYLRRTIVNISGSKPTRV